MMTVLTSAIGPLLLAETLRSTGSCRARFGILARSAACPPPYVTIGGMRPIALLAALALAGIAAFVFTRGNIPQSEVERNRAFTESMSGVVLVGYSTRLDRPGLSGEDSVPGAPRPPPSEPPTPVPGTPIVAPVRASVLPGGAPRVASTPGPPTALRFVPLPVAPPPM